MYDNDLASISLAIPLLPLFLAIQQLSVGTDLQFKRRLRVHEQLQLKQKGFEVSANGSCLRLQLKVGRLQLPFLRLLHTAQRRMLSRQSLVLDNKACTHTE